MHNEKKYQLRKQMPVFEGVPASLAEATSVHRLIGWPCAEQTYNINLARNHFIIMILSPFE